jgi:hypothetical protein
MCRANLEYNLTQDHRILPHLGAKMGLLEETLKSHRIAIALSPPNNTDILFNTAQVLTSLAEALLDAETQQTAKEPARALLEEAVNLFTKCLGVQQEEYERLSAEMNALKAQADQDSSYQESYAQDQSTATISDDLDPPSTSSAPQEWAFIEEPLTPESILETCTAQLNALSTLLPLYTPSSLPNISEIAQTGLTTANQFIPTLINLIPTSPFQAQDDTPAGPTLSITTPEDTEELETTPKDDAYLAVASFNSALADLQYRAEQITATQYATTIETLFSALTKQMSQPAESPDQQSQSHYTHLNVNSAYADALIDLASTIADTPSHIPTSSTYTPNTSIQWTSLTHAQILLTKLSSPPHSTQLPSSRLADIFLARGDVELFRFHLSFSSAGKAAWVSARNVLVANAGVYYRGARAHAGKAGMGNLVAVADAKAVVAEVVKDVAAAGGGDSENLVVKESWKGKEEGVKRVLEQMVEEGILAQEEAEGVLRIVS